MCYETNARPPMPPVQGGSGSGTLITLKASDGTDFAAFAATHANLGGPGIVVLPDVRGLYAFYQELALRFAEAGVHAVAIDYFGRTAGVGTRDDSFDFMTHVMQTTPKGVAADTRAAIDHLVSKEGGQATSVFTVGFCFGGRNSFNQAFEQSGLAGVIGFYGRVARQNDADTNAPVDKASSYTAPVLGLFGGADHGISREDVELFQKTLESEGIRNEIMIYDGAPHSFFDRGAEQFKAESEDAWRRILEFINTNSV